VAGEAGPILRQAQAGHLVPAIEQKPVPVKHFIQGGRLEILDPGLQYQIRIAANNINGIELDGSHSPQVGKDALFPFQGSRRVKVMVSQHQPSGLLQSDFYRVRHSSCSTRQRTLPSMYLLENQAWKE
jgi:hypothetical protein